MRLNLYISKSGYASRRKADILIKNGKVSVNDNIVREPFYRLKLGDSVKLNGGPLMPKEQLYFVFHKPEGVTTTLSDRFAEKKISDFFPPYARGIYPVGRLDKDSSGLIILTNDGDFCYKVTHPKFEVSKEYLAQIDGSLSASDFKKAVDGVKEGGELLRVKAIALVKKIRSKSLLKIVIQEGKKRHIRRLFKQLGCTVVWLKRIKIGNLCLRNLEPGQLQPINKKILFSLLFGKKG